MAVLDLDELERLWGCCQRYELPAPEHRKAFVAVWESVGALVARARRCDELERTGAEMAGNWMADRAEARRQGRTDERVAIVERERAGVDLRTVLAFEAGQEHERAAIVAWLRAPAVTAATEYADAIEAGAHVKREEG